MHCLNCHQTVRNYSANCENCGVFLPSLTREFLPVNQALHHGKYAISDYLGRGGFGLTYAAQQVLLKQPVAIKEFYLLETSHRLADRQTVSTAEQFKEAFQESLQRFLREGQILAGLSHAHIVRVLDLFEENGTAYLVMEYLQGETLKQYKANQRPLPSSEVEKLAKELVSALSALHDQSVYHLDLKPENVIKTEQGLKLIDFGSAKTTSSKTQTRYSYTESYAAPELLTSMGVKPAAQADLYELGVVLYELLTGELPPDPMQRVFNNPGWSPTGLPSPWDRLLMSALQLMPNQRPGDILAWWQGGYPNSQSSRDRPSVVSEEEKECPYCAEHIKVKARKCRYCGEFLEESASNTPSKLQGGVLSMPPPTPAKISSKKLKKPYPQKQNKKTPDNLVIESYPPTPTKSLSTSLGSEPLHLELNMSPLTPLNLLTNSLGMEFVLIQPGTFMMGSPEDEPGRSEREVLHQVTLTEAFYMQTTPVTQAQWQEVMGNNPSHFKGESLPVERVSWEDCQAFIQKLNDRGDGWYTLPIEAQWEYACRAGTTTPFAIGNGHELDSSQANFNGIYPYGKGKMGVSRNKTTPVKSFAPNAWGLYDMHGNVWEWVEDRYGDYPSHAVVNPGGAESGSSRVYRGGSWSNGAQNSRSAYRDLNSPGIRGNYHGFRLVRGQSTKVPSMPSLPVLIVSPPTPAKSSSNSLRPEPLHPVLDVPSPIPAKISSKKLKKSHPQKQNKKTPDNLVIESHSPPPSKSLSNSLSPEPLRRELNMPPLTSSKSFGSEPVHTVLDVQPTNLPKKIGNLLDFLKRNKKSPDNLVIESHLPTPAKSFSNKLRMEFVLIRPGTFMMGSPENEVGRKPDEILHKVTLTEAYYLQTTPVTQAQWKSVMGKNPSKFKGDDRPVENVSWEDCQLFIQKLNELGEGKYALPTEAEWEYACRAGTTTPFAIGKGCDLDSSQANFNGIIPYGESKKEVFRKESKPVKSFSPNAWGFKGKDRAETTPAETTPVKSFLPNAWGLYDMHGNVCEWVQDRYRGYPRHAVSNPVGPAFGSYRVIRGGGWSDGARSARSADRSVALPDVRGGILGFRLICRP